MDATSDDLLKPLGVDRRDPERRLVRRPAAWALGAASGLSLAVLAAMAISVDPHGGEPYAIAPIETRPVGEAEPPRPDAASGRARVHEVPAEAPRRTGAEVGTASGVSVVRPQGAGAPASLVIRIPDAATVQLNPAPDPRLIERGRHGALPKIGADGSRPSTVTRALQAHCRAARRPLHGSPFWSAGSASARPPLPRLSPSCPRP